MKRSRGGDGSGMPNSSKKKAIAIAIRNRRRFPPKEFGAAYFKRGSPVSLATFGPSWREATAAQREERRASGYTGRGGYWGRKIGGLFGMADLGDKLGDIGGSALRHLGMSKYVDAANAAANVMQGSGAYDQVSTNEFIRSVNRPMTFEAPQFGPDAEGATVVVSHREYLGDVYGPASGNFVNTVYSINPGLVSTFPWLSQIASNYDEYDLKQCIFTFRSTTTDIGSSTNGQCGTIIMATQYNAGAPAFTDKQAMMEYTGANSSKTTDNSMHGVECDPAKLSGDPGKYIRTGPAGPGQDIKTYDHAKFNIAITNTPAGLSGQSLGELWISYTVELRKPRFHAARGLDTQRDVFVQPFGANMSGNVPVTTGFFGPLTSKNTQLSGYYNNLGCKLDYTNQRIIFPDNTSGAFRITVKGACYNGPLASGAASVSLSNSANVTPILDLYGSSPGTDTPTNAIFTLGGTDFVCVTDVAILPKPSSQADPTYIQFSQLGTYVPTSFWTEVMIDIVQLNSSFNDANTNIVLVDSRGNFAAV